uniref:Sec-independent periplasmic protein translocase n=1 Tax=Phaeostrophion irregulare TaxID=243268 RepID=UPI002E784A7E|nr:Sec-independent periplasmic protein translocase [Phaeostrophion irregulare]WAM64300.1 Sec-independent periplasmic protein translocase [Phaeostrophion irregulare]
MKKKSSQLNFKFTLIQIICETPYSLTELYFNEHFDEIKHRVYHTLNFLSLIALFTFYKIKLLVKILEGPVSNIQFFQLAPGEYFLSTVIISIYTGLLFCTPFILGQIVFFFGPALKKAEKNIIIWLLISSVVLFLLGLLFSYFILIPAALNFFIFYASEVLEPFLSFNQYFSFISTLFFSTALVFQLPIIQIILSIFKVLDPINMLKFWRPMILFSTILGAILTPSADPITQLLLSSALFFLYFMGTIISLYLTAKTVSI